MRDPRFELFHTDIPFLRAEWDEVDAGFNAVDRAALESLQTAPQLRLDRVYRHSWPIRIFPSSAQRTFVFGTCEFGRYPPNSLVGPDGNERSIDMGAVDLITPSRWSKARFANMGFKDEQIHIVPHGVDPALYPAPTSEVRRQVRDDLQLSSEAYIFLNISNMMWNKGIDLLVAAFAHHRMRNENAVLVLKGGDAIYGNEVGLSVRDAQKPNPDVKNSKVASSIRYLPHNLPQSAVAALYLASDAYVAPYRAEGFNVPVLEALAAALPVITTGGGATDDFCPPTCCRKISAESRTGEVGYYLEPKTGSIIEQMQHVADNAAALRRAALEESRNIKDRYSWQSVTRLLGDVIDA